MEASVPEQLFISTKAGAAKLRIKERQLESLCPLLVHIVIAKRLTIYLPSLAALGAFAAYIEDKRWRATREWAKKFSQTPEAINIAQIVPQLLADFLKSKQVFHAAEISTVLGVSQQTIANWVRAGMLGVPQKQLVHGRLGYIIQREPLQQLLVCTVP